MSTPSSTSSTPFSTPSRTRTTPRPPKSPALPHSPTPSTSNAISSPLSKSAIQGPGRSVTPNARIPSSSLTTGNQSPSGTNGIANGSSVGGWNDLPQGLTSPNSLSKTPSGRGRARDLLRKHYGLGVGPPPPSGKPLDPMNIGIYISKWCINPLRANYSDTS